MSQEQTDEPIERESPDDQPGQEWIYLPSPSEIETACRQIQSEWTDEERLRRAAGLREQTMTRRMRAYAAYHEGSSRRKS